MTFIIDIAAFISSIVTLILTICVGVAIAKAIISIAPSSMPMVLGSSVKFCDISYVRAGSCINYTKTLMSRFGGKLGRLSI
jgi:sorbitol-specific phosphotransferase system component IIBC